MRSYLLIGACNVDLQGFSDQDFTLADCNAGQVSISAGGVVRNIAKAMSYLGQQVSVMSAWGEDYFGSLLKQDLSESSIDFSPSLIRQMGSSSYLNIVDHQGSFIGGLSDMRCIQSITLSEIDKELKRRHYDILVLDGCLSAEVIKGLSTLDKRIYFDPVSMGKAKVLLECPSMFYGLKLNLREAETLFGGALKSEKDFLELYDRLHEKGLEELIITREHLPAYYEDSQEHFFTDVPQVDVVNPSGSGDTFLGAYLVSRERGLSARKSILNAAHCASLSCMVPEPVSRDITLFKGGHHG